MMLNKYYWIYNEIYFQFFGGTNADTIFYEHSNLTMFDLAKI